MIVFNATPIERWAFFLRNAHLLSRDDVGRLFPDPEIAEAARVLEMISKSPEERQLYDLRLKFQSDEKSRIAAMQRATLRVETVERQLAETLAELNSARHELENAQRETENAQREAENAQHEVEAAELEGLRRGEKRGSLLGRIAILQDLLKISEPEFPEVNTLDEDQLAELVEHLQMLLRQRDPAE